MQNSINNGIKVIKSYIENLEHLPGVYRMLSAKGEVLYIGKAKDLPKRIVSYTKIDNLPYRLKRMVAQTTAMETIITKTEVDALLLEARLIRSLQPKYNILLKDDKSFPFIAIRYDHDFPQIIKYRGKQKAKYKLFGPFASTKDIKTTIDELQKIFLLRPCSDSYFSARQRPCMQYQIKRCSAPCVNKISKEDYNYLVDKAIDFLAGKSNKIQEELAQQMQQASDNLEYEKAGQIRDRIKALSYVQAKRNQINLDNNSDIIALYRIGNQSCINIFFFRSGYNYGNKTFFFNHDAEDSNQDIMCNFLIQFYQEHTPPKYLLLSEEIADVDNIEAAILKLHNIKIKITVPKKGDKYFLVEDAMINAKKMLDKKLRDSNQQSKILDKLKEVFTLEEQPKRIEVYDNSHIMGKNAVGAMIVANQEGFCKNQYRKFNFNNDENAIIKGGDDYEMMRMMLTRRFKNMLKDAREYQENIWPDFIIIDGGAGHLTVVQEIMHNLNLNIPFVCIAKGRDRNSGREDFYLPNKDKFKLPKDDKLLYYIQRLRDEAHRFAITSHRGRRSKVISASQLDKIPNIGKKRKNKLLNYFGSFQAIKDATIDDLMLVDGISKKIALEIRTNIENIGSIK